VFGCAQKHYRAAVEVAAGMPAAKASFSIFGAFKCNENDECL
jgi:hypothetical protein